MSKPALLEGVVPDSPRPVVCVVDDDGAILRALRLLLGVAGFFVETFASAEQFLVADRTRRVDCLVLDVHLGGLSGLDLQEQLVHSSTASPVIFITAHDDRVTRERAQKAGAVAYLQKPFDEQALIEAIHRAIGRP